MSQTLRGMQYLPPPLQDLLLGYCVMSLDNRIGMDPTGNMLYPPVV